MRSELQIVTPAEEDVLGNETGEGRARIELKTTVYNVDKLTNIDYKI